MVFISHISSILAVQNLLNALLDSLECLPITTSGQRVALIAIRFDGVGMPLSRAYTFDELCTDPISFYREGVVGVRHIDRIDLLEIGSDIFGLGGRGRKCLQYRPSHPFPHHPQTID